MSGHSIFSQNDAQALSSYQDMKNRTYRQRQRELELFLKFDQESKSGIERMNETAQNTIFRTSFLTILNYNLISQMADEVSQIAQSDRISGACLDLLTTYRKLIIRLVKTYPLINHMLSSDEQGKYNSLQEKNNKLDDIIQKAQSQSSAQIPTPSCQSNGSTYRTGNHSSPLLWGSQSSSSSSRQVGQPSQTQMCSQSSVDRSLQETRFAMLEDRLNNLLGTSNVLKESVNLTARSLNSIQNAEQQIFSDGSVRAEEDRKYIAGQKKIIFLNIVRGLASVGQPVHTIPPEHVELLKTINALFNILKTLAPSVKTELTPAELQEFDQLMNYNKPPAQEKPCYVM